MFETTDESAEEKPAEDKPVGATAAPGRSRRRRLGPFGVSLLIHAVLVLSIWGGIAFTYQRDRVRTVEVAFAESDPQPDASDTMNREEPLEVPPEPESEEPDPELSPDPQWREPESAESEGRVWIGPRYVPLETWRADPVRDLSARRPESSVAPDPVAVVVPVPAPPPVTRSSATAYVPAEPDADNPSPDYPRIARRRGMEGVVLIRAHVSPTGSILSVSVSRSSGHRSLDQAAVECVQTWRFEPARDRGEPVESLVEFPIRFRLRS